MHAQYHVMTAITVPQDKLTRPKGSSEPPSDVLLDQKYILLQVELNKVKT